MCTEAAFNLITNNLFQSKNTIKDRSVFFAGESFGLCSRESIEKFLGLVGMRLADSADTADIELSNRGWQPFLAQIGIDAYSPVGSSLYLRKCGLPSRLIFCGHYGDYHRSGKPAVFSWHRNGVLSKQEFWVNGRRSRSNKPAVSEWHISGDRYREEHWVRGKRHKANKPAVREWHANKQLALSEHWERNRRHCTTGVAVRRWAYSGAETGAEYWVNGKRLTSDAFKKKHPGKA